MLAAWQDGGEGDDGGLDRPHGHGGEHDSDGSRSGGGIVRRTRGVGRVATSRRGGTGAGRWGLGFGYGTHGGVVDDDFRGGFAHPGGAVGDGCGTRGDGVHGRLVHG